ncbi:MAG: insulinase family protein, partial [Acidimicrobiales bacterium]|nr:insulinase family protein [Acidimicrobiales bacterium]
SSTVSSTEPGVGETTSTTAAVIDRVSQVVTPDPDPTPIALDTEVVAGVLDNGLRYYAMSNDSPGAKLELRLVVNAGSAKQPDPDAGSAHFLEHMLFNGTQRFPGLELDRALRSFGMEIGPDLNAYTSMDETVYILSVPTRTEGAVETAFDILVDWATAATIDEQDVIEERGVVREELRLRDESPSGRIQSVLLEAYYADSSYEGHDPSGSVEEVETTTADELRDFYGTWYRLDNMAVVAVGDLDVDDIVELIESSFGPLDAPASQSPRFDYEVDDLDEPFTAVATHPQGPEPNISLDYSIPVWDTSTIGGERLSLLDSLVSDLLVTMLSDGAARGEIDIVRPGGGLFSVSRFRRFVGFNFVADDVAKGSLEVLTAIGRATNQGFGEAEVARAVAGLQARIDQEFQGLGSRQDSSIASALVDHHLTGSAFGDPAETHQRQSAVLSSISADDVNQHLRYLMSRSAPILVPIGSPDDDFPTAERLAEVIVEAEQAAFEGTVSTGSTVSPGDPLMDRPEAIEAVASRTIQAIDATELTYANGLVAYFVESPIAEGSFVLYTISSGGASLLEPGDGPIAELVADAVGDSGVGGFDSVDVATILADASVGAGPYIGDVDEGFSAGGAVDDAEFAFQLVHLLATEPSVETSAWRAAQESGRSWARSFEAEPQAAAYAELLDARFDGSEWGRVYPDVDRLETLTADDALDLYTSRLVGVDDMIAVIVGDFDTADMVELADAYLGSLPTRPGDESIDRSVPMPPGIITREVSAGDEGAGAGFDILMSVGGRVSDADRAAALVLESALNARFFEAVREELAASYSGGSVYIEADPETSTIELLFSVDGDPERLDQIHERVLSELATIADAGLDSAEFDDAKAVVQNDLNFYSNGDLIDQTIDYARNGSDAWTLARRYDAVSRLRVDQVDDLARRLIDITNRIEVMRSL